MTTEISRILKTMPANVVKLVKELEEQSIKDDAARFIEVCDETWEKADPASEYMLRIEKLVANCRQVRDLNLRFHVYLDYGYAFALGAGDICLFSSMMDKLTDDELLFVIGHEMGHIANKDSLWGRRAQLLAKAVGWLAVFSLGHKLGAWGAGAAIKKKFGRKIANSLALKFFSSIATGIAPAAGGIMHSKLMEYKADLYGLQLLESIGGCRNSAITALEKLDDGQETSLLEALSCDHPTTKKRIEQIRMAPAVQA